MKNIVNAGACLVVMLVWSVNIFSAAIENEFGIIKGEKVNLRSEPSLNSRIVKQFLPGELVFYQNRTDRKFSIGEDEDYWFKVRTQENKYGWVFGKFIYYLDGSREPGKYYRRIIIDEIVNGGKLSDDSTNYNISFENLKHSKHIVFRYSHVDHDPKIPILSGWILLFKVLDKKMQMVINTVGHDSIYSFVERYILIESSSGIRVYDTSKFIEGPYAYKKDMVYENVFYLNVRDKINESAGESLGKSIIKFDRKENIAILDVKDEEGVLLRSERYKFEDGKFLKMD